MRTSIAVFALALAACGGGGGGGDDAPPFDAPTVDVPPSGNLTFRLSFQSDAIPDSIFVQSGTEFGGQGWLTVRPVGGVDLPILDDCGQCNCDSCDPCAVCGVGLPVVTAIPHGEHLDWSWDMSVYRDGTCAGTGGSCEQADPLAPGSYVAKFCWSFTSDGVGPGHHIGPVTCADEPFELPAAAPPPSVIEHALCACG